MDRNGQDHARADFDRAYRRAWLHGLVDTLAGRENGLVAYDEARRAVVAEGESYRGVRAVPVERIVGSTDRAGDYDRSFRPRRRHTADRWQSVARAAHAGTDLPPVRLRQIGDDYFVVDGHHRVSVARALGQAFVDAEVVELRVRTPAPATWPAPTSGRSTQVPRTPRSTAGARPMVVGGCPA